MGEQHERSGRRVDARCTPGGDWDDGGMSGGGGEAARVELVDGTGGRVGVATVAQAHRAPGLLHRAFSVLLLDPDGLLLLQRRSAAKTRFPLRWANSCCGHPAPGEPLATAAARRLAEELGVTGVDLVEIGVHQYQAGDPATGRAEHEYDHVLLGRVPAGSSPRPDPAEVAELRWVAPAELLREIAVRPDPYAPWLAGVVRLLGPAGPDAVRR
jgi:isopentenyl-diphosphate delta-isomerase